MGRTFIVHGLVVGGLMGCALPEADLASETDICFACAEQSCSAEFNACFADMPCQGLLNCVQSCPTDDMACLADCTADNPDGLTLATPLLDCATASCPDDCASLEF